MNPDHSRKTLGALLAEARTERNLPIERAAHDTRIRVQRLREIEADDYTHFSHPSYLRMFLMDYARYLEIPLEEIHGWLPEPGECGAGGYEYLQNFSEEGRLETVRRHRPQRRLLPVAVGVIVVFACALAGVQVWTTVRKIDRLQGRTTEAEESLKVAEPKPVASNAATDRQVLEEAAVEVAAAEPAASQDAELSPAPAASPEAVPTGDSSVLFVGGVVGSGNHVQ